MNHEKITMYGGKFMPLDLSSLRKAVDAFEKTLKVSNDQTFMAGLTDDQKEAIRAGVIQNFEVAYEMCWKYIQRWLKENAAASETEYPRTRKELFRLAAQYGLINDPQPWFSYGEARNLTSHTYNEAKAEAVFEVAGEFLNDARILLERMEKRND
jgi:nucleotidyltransferase substrate binding protein (TIGR01987 family)